MILALHVADLKSSRVYDLSLSMCWQRSRSVKQKERKSFLGKKRQREVCFGLFCLPFYFFIIEIQFLVKVLGKIRYCGMFKKSSPTLSAVPEFM